MDISLVTAEGKLLLSTSTSKFPIAPDYTGIGSASGVITITYYYEAVIQAATETTPAVTEKKSKSFTRNVEFSRE